MDRRGVDTFGWLFGVAIALALLVFLGFEFGGDINRLFSNFLKLDIPEGDDEIIDVDPAGYTAGCPSEPNANSVCKEYSVQEACYLFRSSCWDNKVRPCGTYLCTPVDDGKCTQSYLGGGSPQHYVEERELDGSLPECVAIDT